MDARKSSDVVLWAKANKFLIGFITLLMIALAVVEGLYTNRPFSLGMLPLLILIGGLIWSVYIRKKGAVTIALGVIFAWVALVSWITFLCQDGFSISFFSFDILVTFLSALMFYFGIKSYRRTAKEQNKK